MNNLFKIDTALKALFEDVGDSRTPLGNPDFQARMPRLTIPSIYRVSILKCPFPHAFLNER